MDEDIQPTTQPALSTQLERTQMKPTLQGVSVRQRLQAFIPDYKYLISVSGLIILLDQITKVIVRTTIPKGKTWEALAWLEPYFRIIYWENRGAAFGLFQGGGGIFGILAILVSIAIFIYYPVIARSDKWMRLALALQLAGALGNLIDRLMIGAVTDFISIWTFPVFNLADLSITTGVIILLLPYLPHLPKEWAVYQQLKLARQINARHRVPQSNPTPKPTQEDDSVTLGILEVILHDTSPVREFILSQRAKRIHHQYNHTRKPSPGRDRQPRN